MHKKLLTLAVAAAVAAPAAAMADATMYGRAEVSLDSWDVGDNVYGGTIGPSSSLRGGVSESDWEDFDGLDVGDGYHSNRIGVKGSEDLGNGLKAIYKMEFAVSLADADSSIGSNSGSAVTSSRNAYVGLAGDWGTFLIGRHDTPLKISSGSLDMFADTAADYNFGNGFVDIRIDNVLVYISPNWNGLTLVGALIAPGGKTVGSDFNPDSDGFEAQSVALMYSNGPFFASAAYENVNDEAVSAGATDDDEKWRIGLGYTMNAFSVGAVYENQDAGGTLGNEFDRWQISASYTFGNNVVKAMYGQNDLDGGSGVSDEDTDTWAIGIDHNFSKRTKAYALYTEWENDDVSSAEYDVFSVGLVHSF